jgi:hypothetical protein
MGLTTVEASRVVLTFDQKPGPSEGDGLAVTVGRNH